jgi:hypothetical protein
MANGSLPMTDEDRAQLGECIRRAGGPKAAAIALGVNVATLARAFAGLPVLPMSASYLRMSMPRVLDRLPVSGPVVERAG